MQIALFGGTFDPPHSGHTTLVKEVLDRGLFDQVWYVPVGQHQLEFTKTHMNATGHRLAMLELVQIDRTRIETFEIDSHQASHTHTTLRALSQRYPEHTFSFLMGSDQLPKLHLWNCDQDTTCFPQAADEFAYYVYPRAGFPLDLPFTNLRLVEGVTPMAVASTTIRGHVATGQSIQGLVSPAVAEYIEKNQLYVSA